MQLLFLEFDTLLFSLQRNEETLTNPDEPTLLGSEGTDVDVLEPQMEDAPRQETTVEVNAVPSQTNSTETGIPQEAASAPSLDIVEQHFDNMDTAQQRGDSQVLPVEAVGMSNREQVTGPGVERQKEVTGAGVERQREVIREDFKPLTWEQLKSLYYNVNLETNAAYIDKFIQVITYTVH